VWRVGAIFWAGRGAGRDEQAEDERVGVGDSADAHDVALVAAVVLFALVGAAACLADVVCRAELHLERAPRVSRAVYHGEFGLHILFVFDADLDVSRGLVGHVADTHAPPPTPTPRHAPGVGLRGGCGGELANREGVGAPGGVGVYKKGRECLGRGRRRGDGVGAESSEEV